MNDKLATKRKPRRTIINGTRNVLTVSGKEPGFEYRIVNDDGDRISQFEERGYEIVKDQNIKVGDRRIANPTKEGSPIQVSVGGGTKAFVMRVPKEFFDEDRAAKDKHIDDLERGTLKEARESADYGKVSVA
jgi:hypothetical protein